MLNNKSFKKAVILIIISGLTSSLLCVCAKRAGEISPIQKVFFQNLTVIVFGLPIMIKKNIKIVWEKPIMIPLLLRCTLGIIAAGLSFYCLQKMYIADVNMLLQLYPIFSAILGWLILKEKFPASNWFYYFLSLIGCLLIIKPSAQNVLLIPSLFCVICALISAVNINLMRILGKKGMIGLPVIFFFGIFCVIVCFPWMIFNFEPINLNQIFSLMGLGIFTLVTQVLLSYAYTMIPCGRLSIYSYIGLIFCGVNGYLFFKEIPDILSFIGYALIILVAIFLYLRDNKEKN